MSVKGKEVRRGKTTGKTSDWKKAIVTIDTNPGDIKYLDKGGKKLKFLKNTKTLSNILWVLKIISGV